MAQRASEVGKTSKATQVPADTTIDTLEVTDSPQQSDQSGTWSWNIDNKYYTASVQFISRPVRTGALGDSDVNKESSEEYATGVPVIMYLFEGDVSQPNHLYRRSLGQANEHSNVRSGADEALRSPRIHSLLILLDSSQPKLETSRSLSDSMAQQVNRVEDETWRSGTTPEQKTLSMSWVSS